MWTAFVFRKVLFYPHILGYKCWILTPTDWEMVMVVVKTKPNVSRNLPHFIRKHFATWSLKLDLVQSKAHCKACIYMSETLRNKLLMELFTFFTKDWSQTTFERCAYQQATSLLWEPGASCGHASIIFHFFVCNNFTTNRLVHKSIT